MDEGRRIRVLHVILMLGETNGQYNEHCLPMVGIRDLSICTYFVPRLTPPPEISMFPGDGSLPGFFRALRAALDAKEYDVVHVHAPETGALVVLALLRWRRFRRLRPCLVYTVQDSFFDYKLQAQATMLVALASYTRVVFCSRAAYDSVPRALRWLVGDRWRVVQNGADIDRVDRALASGSAVRGDGAFTVLSVGRLEAVKDPVALLDAFAEASADDAESRLVFIGAGSLQDAVARRTRELRMDDRVVMTGLISRDDVFVRCASADVFVSTSRGEGLPVAVIEAMASGCPVILSDIPPHWEVLGGADFVPLIAPGDILGFAEGIRRFRSMRDEERRELGHRCRDHVVSRFTLPVMHARIDAVYRELPTLSDTRSRAS
jgi:glycosyltransferase involved in cell wall biosynthesis